MLLQRFINRTQVLSSMRLLTIATVVIVMAGCASTEPKRSGSATTGGRVEASEAQPQRAAPARVRTLYEQAIAVMATGDFVDAELRLKEFLLQYPNYPGAYVNLAIIHSANGDDLAAEANINAALALDENHPEALNQKGMSLRRNGKFIEAEAAYLKAVTARPDYALAHYNLGVLNELYLQRLDAALQHFERYFELVGDDKQVEKWITDLTRRLAASQRTANVTE